MRRKACHKPQIRPDEESGKVGPMVDPAGIHSLQLANGHYGGDIPNGRGTRFVMREMLIGGAR